MKNTTKYPDVYWERRLDENTPERVREAIMHVYNSYPMESLPQGVCDPLYIMNVICMHLGVGDGKGNFNIKERD